jgi:hypothetical protein
MSWVCSAACRLFTNCCVTVFWSTSGLFFRDFWECFRAVGGKQSMQRDINRQTSSIDRQLRVKVRREPLRVLGVHLWLRGGGGCFRTPL